MSNNTGLSFPPQIAVSEDGNAVYVTWHDNTSGENATLLARSIGGIEFGAPVDLSDNTGFDAAIPRVITFGDTVYVVWQDRVSGGNDIFFARSIDGGNTFGEAVNLSNNPGDSTFPQVAVGRDGTVHVAWTDTTPSNNDVFIATSNDNGTTFDDPFNLSNNEGASFPPRIAAGDGGAVYVVWADNTPGNNEILLAKSDGGAFGKAVNLSNNTGSSFRPRIATTHEGDALYVTWHDNTGSNNEVFLARNTGTEAGFDAPINLSNNTGESVFPEIAVSGDNNTAYVTWQDNTSGGFDILVAKSADRAASNTVNLSNNAGDSIFPQIAAGSSGTIHVAWQDGSPDNDDIFFDRSIDGGNTFGEAVNLSNNNGESVVPVLVASDMTTFVAWTDSTQGNNEIFVRVVR